MVLASLLPRCGKVYRERVNAFGEAFAQSDAEEHVEAAALKSSMKPAVPGNPTSRSPAKTSSNERERRLAGPNCFHIPPALDTVAVPQNRLEAMNVHPAVPTLLVPLPNSARLTPRRPLCATFLWAKHKSNATQA